MGDKGNVYLYAKESDDVRQLHYVLQNIGVFYGFGDVFISREPRRSFSELEKIKGVMGENDVCIITNPAVLGLNEADIANQLEWFIRKPRILLIYDFKTTYQWGVSEPLNQAILQTIQQSVLERVGNRVLRLPENRKSNAGRSHVEFPKDWAELYGQWENKEISSKEFLAKSGLKRATFYNLIAEYRKMKEDNEVYFKMYRSV